jgi:hypothetical protein
MGQTPDREAVGNGEPPEPAQSEPINNSAKKQHHTERNKQPQCRASEGVFAPRWHINLPLVGARVVVHSKENPAIEVAGLPDGKAGAGGLGGSPSGSSTARARIGSLLGEIFRPRRGVAA